MVRVGLVGCGTIGTQVALALQREYPTRARLVALHDIDPAQASALARRLHPRPRLVSLAKLIQTSGLVIEAASAGVAGEVAGRALRANRFAFIMSVGGLLRDASWKRAARRSSGRVYVPSGALAGLDGVKAMALGRLRRVSLTTRKPPRALASAPYVRRRGLRLRRLTRPTLLFEGSPRAVVSAFPQNTNVAAAVALAAGAAARPRIRVVADPTIRMNIHELDVVGDSGRITCRIASRPSANPRTSELAVRSAVATLGRLFDTVLVGT
jgi:aspartate dehydrogenase